MRNIYLCFTFLIKKTQSCGEIIFQINLLQWSLSCRHFLNFETCILFTRFEIIPKILYNTHIIFWTWPLYMYVLNCLFSPYCWQTFGLFQTNMTHQKILFLWIVNESSLDRWYTKPVSEVIFNSYFKLLESCNHNKYPRILETYNKSSKPDFSMNSYKSFNYIIVKNIN